MEDFWKWRAMDSPEDKSWKFHELEHPEPVNAHFRIQCLNDLTDMLFCFYLNNKKTKKTWWRNCTFAAFGIWLNTVVFAFPCVGQRDRHTGRTWFRVNNLSHVWVPCECLPYWCTIDAANMTPSQWKPQRQHVKYTRTESIPMSCAAFTKVTLRKPCFFLFGEDHFWNLQVNCNWRIYNFFFFLFDYHGMNVNNTHSGLYCTPSWISAI